MCEDDASCFLCNLSHILSPMNPGSVILLYAHRLMETINIIFREQILTDSDISSELSGFNLVQWELVSIQVNNKYSYGFTKLWMRHGT